MPLYHFDLLTSSGITADVDGAEFPDERSARHHAGIVARELMRNRKARTQSWRILVSDDERRHCFSVLFSSIDQSFAHLTPELKHALQTHSAAQSYLFETISDLGQTLRQVRATMARADGALHLCSVNGVRL